LMNNKMMNDRTVQQLKEEIAFLRQENKELKKEIQVEVAMLKQDREMSQIREEMSQMNKTRVEVKEALRQMVEYKSEIEMFRKEVAQLNLKWRNFSDDLRGKLQMFLAKEYLFIVDTQKSGFAIPKSSNGWILVSNNGTTSNCWAGSVPKKTKMENGRLKVILFLHLLTN